MRRLRENEGGLHGDGGEAELLLLTTYYLLLTTYYLLLTTFTTYLRENEGGFHGDGGEAELLRALGACRAEGVARQQRRLAADAHALAAADEAARLVGGWGWARVRVRVRVRVRARAGARSCG